MTWSFQAGACSSKHSLPRGGLLHGFTLIECLLVITLIALLITILLPALRHAKEVTRRAMCASNLRQVTTGVLMYATDANHRLPGILSISSGGYAWTPTTSWAQLMPIPEAVPGGDHVAGIWALGYVPVKRTFFCPSGWTHPTVEEPAWDAALADAGTPIPPGVSSTAWLNMGYMFLARRTVGPLDVGPSPDENPRSLKDPPSWVLWIDTNWYNTELDTYASSHIPNYVFPPEWPWSSRPPAGTNIAFLDTSVSWRDYSEMDFTGAGHHRWANTYIGW